MAEVLSHPVPAVILLLGILVLVHELGHFLVGRWCGIAVEMFSIGFGPKIVSFVRRGTDFRIAWIPLGGFVKFAGAHPSEDVPEGLKGIPFRDAPRSHRVATVAAGPLANFLLAVVVYGVLGSAGIKHPPAEIGGVVENSPAQAAGIQYGDRIVRIDDKEIRTWRDLEQVISKSPGRSLAVEVLRGGSKEILRLTPERIVSKNIMGNEVEIGRAGVALGRAAAVVAVTQQNSPAHVAGLQTGDRVLDFTDSTGKKEISFYPDFLDSLAGAAARGEVSVTLTVQRADIPGETNKDEKSGEKPVDADAGKQAPAGTSKGSLGRQLTLDLSSVKGVDENSAGIARALGLTDAQLTFAKAADPSMQGIFRVGDRLLSWNGIPLRNVFHHRELQLENKRQEVDLVVQRGFKEVPITLNLKPVEAQRPQGKVTLYAMPVYFWGQLEEPEYVVEVYDNPLEAAWYGIKRTARESVGLVVTVGQLVTGDIPLGALGGPMLIASVASESVKRGWKTFLSSMAIISINLAVINLLPIPVLDGGQLVLLGAEWVRRRPLREAAIENFQKIGFVMILALVVLATYNDLSRFWKSMLESLVGAF